MKRYLVDFLNDFQFPETAKKELLSTYARLDEIGATQKIKAVVEEYRNALISFDGGREKIDELANETQTHVYTLHLIYLIYLADVLKERYKEKGYPESVWKDSMSDLKYKLLDTQALCGVCGTKSVGFHKIFFEMRRFGFGKLQFDITTFKVRVGGVYQGEYHKNGLDIEQTTPVLGVHIPRTGEKLDYESVKKSYEDATNFVKKHFKEQFSGKVVFVLRTWMLFDRLKGVLSPQSNLMRFCGDYDVFVHYDYPDYAEAWRIFDKPYEGDLSVLPKNTTLQKFFANIIKKGEKIGGGAGVYCLDFEK